MKRTRRMRAVVEVTFIERENDGMQCGVPREPQEMTGGLMHHMAAVPGDDVRAIENSVLLSLEEEVLPCAHLIATRVRQTDMEPGFAAWECLLSDERIAFVYYANDTLTVEVDSEQVAKEADLSGLSFKVMGTQEMLDVLGFAVCEEDQPYELSGTGSSCTGAGRVN